MSYCPACRENVQLVVSTSSNIHWETKSTDVYHTNENDTRKYKIGEFESEQSYTTTETTPRCSICYREIHHPTIHSESDLRSFYESNYNDWKKYIIPALEREIGFIEMKVAKAPKDSRIVPIVSGIVLSGITFYFYSLAIKVDPLVTRTYLAYLGYWFLVIAFGMPAVIVLLSSLSPSESYENNLSEYKKAKEDLIKKKREREKIQSSSYKGYDDNKDTFIFY